MPFIKNNTETGASSKKQPTQNTSREPTSYYAAYLIKTSPLPSNTFRVSKKDLYIKAYENTHIKKLLSLVLCCFNLQQFCQWELLNMAQQLIKNIQSPNLQLQSCLSVLGFLWGRQLWQERSWQHKILKPKHHSVHWIKEGRSGFNRYIADQTG